MIIWLTGNSGAGKTTTAYNFLKIKDCVILDGDEMRDSISLDTGFSKEEREEHNLRVARLANVLSRQGQLVIVSVIAPFRDTRKKIEKIIPKVHWVYIKRKLKKDEQRPYEIPKDVDLIIDTDKHPEDKCAYMLFELFAKYRHENTIRNSR